MSILTSHLSLPLPLLITVRLVSTSVSLLVKTNKFTIPIPDLANAFLVLLTVAHIAASPNILINSLIFLFFLRMRKESTKDTL